MYKETQPACKMASPDNRHKQNQQVISFVDDNKLMQNPQGTEIMYNERQLLEEIS